MEPGKTGTYKFNAFSSDFESSCNGSSKIAANLLSAHQEHQRRKRFLSYTKMFQITLLQFFRKKEKTDSKELQIYWVKVTLRNNKKDIFRQSGFPWKN